jgi:hypothetical protein
MIASLPRLLPALLVAALPFAASAELPDACEIVKDADINPIAERPVVKTRPQKSGNPTECAFLDSRNGAVLVVMLKEVKYAVKDEFETERANMEKIYRVKVKPLETVGEAAFWMPANKSIWFRKGKVIGSVTFQAPKNQTELDTATVARLVESRLK